MKALVTGGSGFIGSRVILQLLASGHDVKALSMDPKDDAMLAGTGAEAVRGDITDRSTLIPALSGVKAVYHLAARVGAWQKDPGAFYSTNVLGTKTLLDACHESDIEGVVLCLSAGIYGFAGEEGVNEKTRIEKNDHDPYIHSKQEALALMKTYASNSPMKIVAVSPTRVYGPGNLTPNNGFTVIMDKYSRHQWHLIPGNGSEIGNYVYVDDVVRGCIAALEHGRQGEDYILGGENVSIDEFFRHLISVTGVRQRLIHIPSVLLCAGGKVSTTLSNLLNVRPFLPEAIVTKLTSDCVVSCRKAERELNYRPTPLRSGMARTIEWLERGR